MRWPSGGRLARDATERLGSRVVTAVRLKACEDGTPLGRQERR